MHLLEHTAKSHTYSNAPYGSRGARHASRGRAVACRVSRRVGYLAAYLATSHLAEAREGTCTSKEAEAVYQI